MTERSVPGETIAHNQERTAIFKHLKSNGQARSCAELLTELKAVSRADARTLHFDGVDGNDVYNITAPFCLDGKTLLMGRTEPRETEFSRIVVFEKAGHDRWAACYTHPDFDGLQDPCITWAGSDLVVGGVRYPISTNNAHPSYRMDFYRGSSLESLNFFFSGPLGMKDIRFKQLSDGRVAIFSRPQGAIGGRGQIGFTIASSWNVISAELIASAPLFSEQMLTEEWGGVNEVHLLANGRLGVLGHIACFDSGHYRHYYPMVFMVDPKSGHRSAIQIIARRSFFPETEAKRPDLADVVFSGGIVRNGNGAAHFYAGISDVAAAVVELPDPFVEFETSV